MTDPIPARIENEHADLPEKIYTFCPCCSIYIYPRLIKPHLMDAHERSELEADALVKEWVIR